MQQASPLLYVFYRDGTFFYIPYVLLQCYGSTASEIWMSDLEYLVGGFLNPPYEQAELSSALVLSMFGFIATFTSITEHLACANWEG